MAAGRASMDGTVMPTLGRDKARSGLAGLDGAGGQAGGAERAGDGNHCDGGWEGAEMD